MLYCLSSLLLPLKLLSQLSLTTFNYQNWHATVDTLLHTLIPHSSLPLSHFPWWTACSLWFSSNITYFIYLSWLPHHRRADVPLFFSPLAPSQFHLSPINDMLLLCFFCFVYEPCGNLSLPIHSLLQKLLSSTSANLMLNISNTHTYTAI